MMGPLGGLIALHPDLPLAARPGYLALVAGGPPGPAAQAMAAPERAAQRVVGLYRGRAQALRLVDVLCLDRVRLFLEIV